MGDDPFYAAEAARDQGGEAPATWQLKAHHGRGGSTREGWERLESLTTTPEVTLWRQEDLTVLESLISCDDDHN